MVALRSLGEGGPNLPTAVRASDGGPAFRFFDKPCSEQSLTNRTFSSSISVSRCSNFSPMGKRKQYFGSSKSINFFQKSQINCKQRRFVRLVGKMPVLASALLNRCATRIDRRIETNYAAKHINTYEEN
jgi:hypothetical protein